MYHTVRATTRIVNEFDIKETFTWKQYSAGPIEDPEVVNKELTGVHKSSGPYGDYATFNLSGELPKIGLYKRPEARGFLDFNGILVGMIWLPPGNKNDPKSYFNLKLSDEEGAFFNFEQKQISGDLYRCDTSAWQCVSVVKFSAIWSGDFKESYEGDIVSPHFEIKASFPPIWNTGSCIERDIALSITHAYTEAWFSTVPVAEDETWELV